MAPPVNSEEPQQMNNSSDSYKLCFKVVCNGCHAKFSDYHVIPYAEYCDYTNPCTSIKCILPSEEIMHSITEETYI